MDNEKILKCREVSRRIRRDIIDMTYSTGNIGAHLGGSLSMVEMLATLYTCIIKFDKKNPLSEERDRVILSKGHSALALYPALVQIGAIKREDLLEFKKDGSKISAHPSLNGIGGVEFSSGSLGQGLSLGVGVCLALRKKENTNSRVFVFLGDGECDEGSVWEAAASAAHYNLNQLVAIVDENQIQYDGYTNEVLNMTSMGEKWRSFGWEVVRVDGHNICELINAYSKKTFKPLVILARTVKGKGISYMENNWKFHNSRLSKEQYELAIQELEKGQ